MRSRRFFAFAFLAVVVVAAQVVPAHAQPSRQLQERSEPQKPAHATVPEGASRQRLHVKFVEGSQVRLRGGRLVSEGDDDMSGVDAVFRRHRGITVERLFDQPEASLSRQKKQTEARSGREQADFNLYFRLRLTPRTDEVAVLNELNALDIVEIAYAEPLPAPPPQTPDFTADQDYREAAPDGIDADFARAVPGGRGQNVRVIDIEYSWNVNHEDLPAARAPGAVINNGTPSDPFSSNDHGTAVLGEIAAADNGFGVTGLADQAAIGMVNANNTEDGYDLADAINLATTSSAPGDVILLEQQISGATACNNGVSGCVAVEHVQAYYDAIVAATSAGRIVVEAAGNGNEDLDSAGYSATFGGRADSGAIIVGAANNVGCTAPVHGRRGSSTFGSRVNFHAYGECVTTTGYGGLQGSSESNDAYTSFFSGTSSASPIVTSAAAILSSVAQQQGDADGLTSSEVRTLLAAGATPQDTTSSALTGAIGPMPNLAGALQAYVPVARITGSLATAEGTDVTLSAATSSDPQGQPLTYAWDLDDDGAFDDATGDSATFTDVGQDGTFPVSLQVTDAGGAIDVDEAVVTVANVAPDVFSTVTTAPEGALVTVGGSASDAGWLDDLTVTVDWDDGAALETLAGMVENNRPDATVALNGGHRFGDNGTPSIEVCVADDDTQTCDTHVVAVDNVSPSVALDETSVVLDEGDNLDIAATFSDPGWLDTYTSSVDWGTGESEPGALTVTKEGSASDGSDEGTLTASHDYGDNGSFMVTAGVTDDDLGTGSDSLSVTVNNIDPTAVIDVSGGTVINGVSTILGSAGDPVDLSARSTDVGSDDLTLSWDFDDGSTASRFSAVTPPSPDPFPSPNVIPRDETDNQAHAFTDACLYDIVFSSGDDDGGSAEDQAAVLITGEAQLTRTAGYWRQQLAGSGSRDFDADALECFLSITGFVSTVFDEERSAATIPEAEAVLSTQGGLDAREHLDRQLLAALLNFANGSVAYDEMVDVVGTSTPDMTFAELVAGAEAVRLDAASTVLDINEQKDMLERLNRRDG